MTVVEWLQFQVEPEWREKFVQVDAEIWTAYLAKQEGFLKKEVWISPDALDDIVLVIHWQTLEQWQSIPKPELKRVDDQFKKALGKPYKTTNSRAYQVRKTNYPA
jgi:uncharacterized protein (TIGR03792 family)